MVEEFRLKIEGSPERWVSQASKDGWLTSHLCELWRAALASDAGGPRKNLQEAVALAGEIGFGSSFSTLRIPRSKEDAAARRAKMAARRQEEVREKWGGASGSGALFSAMGWGKERSRGNDVDGDSPHENPWARSALERGLSADEESLCLFETVTSRMLDIPSAKVSSRKGTAALFSAERALAVVEKAKKVKRLSLLVPKANGEAAALGFAVPSWLEPGRAPAACRELAGAQAELFSPSDEFDGRACFAIYVEPNPDNLLSVPTKGFMGDANGGVGIFSDLADASMFSSKSAAKKFGERHACDAFLVELRVSAVGYAPLRGERTSADLAAVRAKREAGDIASSLALAEIEQLRAELSRREAALEDPAARAPRANRL